MAGLTAKLSESGMASRLTIFKAMGIHDEDVDGDLFKLLGDRAPRMTPYLEYSSDAGGCERKVRS